MKTKRLKGYRRKIEKETATASVNCIRSNPDKQEFAFIFPNFGSVTKRLIKTLKIHQICQIKQGRLLNGDKKCPKDYIMVANIKK
jgi:hypothetical protein